MPGAERESGPERDRLLELEQELELLKQVLLRAIIEETKSGGEINEDLLRKIRGYLPVAKRLAEVVQLRSRDPELAGAPAVRLVWEVLNEIPNLRELLAEAGIKEQILKRIRERLKADQDAAQS